MQKQVLIQQITEKLEQLSILHLQQIYESLENTRQEEDTNIWEEMNEDIYARRQENNAKRFQNIENLL